LHSGDSRQIPPVSVLFGARPGVLPGEKLPWAGLQLEIPGNELADTALGGFGGTSRHPLPTSPPRRGCRARPALPCSHAERGVGFSAPSFSHLSWALPAQPRPVCCGQNTAGITQGLARAELRPPSTHLPSEQSSRAEAGHPAHTNTPITRVPISSARYSGTSRLVHHPLLKGKNNDRLQAVRKIYGGVFFLFDN